MTSLKNGVSLALTFLLLEYELAIKNNVTITVISKLFIVLKIVHVLNE
jgi:hypothetical protein